MAWYAERRMVKAFFRNGASVILRRQSTILSAASVLMLAALLSAVLGFVRWRILFTYFGNSSDLGIFLLADRIPSFIFNIMISGTFASVFIPVFSSWRRQNETEAWQIARTMFSVMMLIFSFLILALLIGARPISQLISVNQLNEEQLSLMVKLLRLMLFAQLGLVASAFFTGLLHSFQHFIIPALAPVFYWASSILFIIYFVDELGIAAAAWGMILGSLLHVLVQIPIAKKLGFTLAPLFEIRSYGFRQILKLMGPRMLGQIAPEVARLVEGSLAVSITIFSTALLTAAQTLYYFPITLFAVAIAQAAFPFLADKAMENDLQDFKKTFIASFHQTLFFMVPLVFIVVVLRLPAVRLVFGSDEFRWESTVMTGYTLAYLAIGMLAQSLVHLLVRSFYALQDTVTPLKAGVVMSLVQVGLGLYLITKEGLPVWGLALAYAIAVNIQALILFRALYKKIGGFGLRVFFRPVVRMLTAGFVTGALTYMVFKMLDRYSWGHNLSLGPIQLPTTLYNVIIDTSFTINLIYFTFIVGCFSLGMYLLLTYLMGVEEIRVIMRMIGERLARVSLKSSQR